MAEKKELAVTEEKVVEIEMERLRSFENHPFKVRADSQMIELQESVKKYGILNPLIVRPRKDGTYEIISGHRRKFAAEKIGYRKVPVIIRVNSLSGRGKGMNISRKNILEELKHGIFSERSRNITDTRNRTWSRSWNLGCNQPYGRIR